MITVGRCLLPDRLRRAGISQQRLAELTGIPKSTISEYVNNKHTMNLKNAKIIAVELDCSIDELYEWVFIGRPE